MSNTLGTLSSSLILQEALSLVFTKRPMLSMISKDLAPQNAKLNQQIITRVHSIPAVGNFPNGIQNKVDTDVPVTLDQFKHVGYEFTATELNSTDRNLVREAAEPLAVAMANQLVDSVAALWQSATNYVLDATPDYETLVKLRKHFIDNGVQGDRWLAVNAATYASLLQDPLCNRYYKSGGNDPIAEGELAGVAGFSRIFEYPATPTANDMIGFAGTKESVILASRIPRDPREVLPNAPANGNIEVITDPTTGFSVLAVESIDVNTLSAKVFMTWIYGVATGRNVAGCRLVSND